MKKTFFLIPMALVAVALNASATEPLRPIPPAEATDQLAPLGVEFLQLLNARDQQSELIADKMKALLEMGNTIKQADVTYRPHRAGDAYRRYAIRVQQCGMVIVNGRREYHCFGGGKLTIVKTGVVIPGGIYSYTTELVRFRETH